MLRLKCLPIVALLVLAFCCCQAQEHKFTLPNEPPTDLKVLEEYRDEQGNYVRTIEYHVGKYRVVQTVKKPSEAKLLTRPISADTLIKDSLYVQITKSKYKCDLYYRGKRIRSYHAVFGPRPLENKNMEGDRCTPEGCYRIKYKNPNSQYYRFMLLDYPNDSSVMRFKQLMGEGKVPKTAKMGGDVGIHGTWKGGEDLIELGVGWTDGCIALKNNDVEELFKLVPVGTKVVIKR